MTARPEHIEAREFSVAWRGYNRDEVRGFLRDVAVALRGAELATPEADDSGEPKLLDPSLVQWPDIPRRQEEASTAGPVPETIEVREFSVAWRGYNRDEVRGFLREVADGVRTGDADAAPPGTDADAELTTAEPSADGEAEAETEATTGADTTVATDRDSDADTTADTDRESDGGAPAHTTEAASVGETEIDTPAAGAAGTDQAVPLVGAAPSSTDAASDTWHAGAAIAASGVDPSADHPADEPEGAAPDQVDEDVAVTTPEVTTARLEADLEVAIVERATDAAMALRRDARRASTTMRHRAEAYADEGRTDADSYVAVRRQEANQTVHEAEEALRSAQHDALAVRARLTAESSARLQARRLRSQTDPAGELASADDAADPPAHLRSRDEADLSRLRMELARAETTIARLEAEVTNAVAQNKPARAGAPAVEPTGADSGPAADDLARREAAARQQEQRLETLRVEAEALQANAVDQRVEAERLRLEAQRQRDEANRLLADAQRRTGLGPSAPTPPGEPTSTPPPSPTSPPGTTALTATPQSSPEPPSDPEPPSGGSADARRPISRTAPPGLGLTPAEADDDSDDALADMVRDALDTGLPPDD